MRFLNIQTCIHDSAVFQNICRTSTQYTYFSNGLLRAEGNRKCNVVTVSQYKLSQNAIMMEESDAWVASVFMIAIGGVITFYALAVVCDEYLIPVSNVLNACIYHPSLDKQYVTWHFNQCIDYLCTRWKIPENVAAASILAFGSSAPEIVMACSTTMQKKVCRFVSTVLLFLNTLFWYCGAGRGGRLSSFLSRIC